MYFYTGTSNLPIFIGRGAWEVRIHRLNLLNHLLGGTYDIEQI